MRGTKADSSPMTNFAKRTLSSGGAVIVAAMVLGAPVAHAAGTAFGVDTAEVGDPGNCKVEAWGSTANNGDRLATVNPSCIFNFGTPTEVSTQVVRSRSDDEWATSISPKAKAKLLTPGIGSFGFAAVVGGSYDPKESDVTALFAYVPATIRLSEIVRININGGWLQDRSTDRNFATYGLGLDWKWTETVTFTAETFGQAGKSDGSTDTQPRFQTGLRWRPVDRFSMDFIYGRNINGENADWLTVGATIRFPPN